jgi:hypothetical protein
MVFITVSKDYPAIGMDLMSIITVIVSINVKLPIEYSLSRLPGSRTDDCSIGFG